MDQDSEVEKKPKYAEYYKNAEARKKYQREYQLNRYHTKVKKNPDKEYKKDEVKEQMETAPKNDVKGLSDGLGVVADLLGNDDPISKNIKKYEKVIMFGLQFLQGFANSYQEKQEQKRMQQPQQQQGVPAPDGWQGSTNMQRLNKKYLPNGNINPWYAQGQAYEESKESNGMISQFPVDMQHTIHGSREAAIQSRNSKNETQKYESMAQLNARSNEWDKKSDGVNMEKAKVVERTDDAPKNINEALKQKKQDNQEEEGLQEIGNKLMEDATKYLNLVKLYFKNRTMTDFEKDLRNIDKTMTQYESMIDILPFQAKEIFKRMSIDDWEKLIIDADPEKIRLIQKKKLKPKLKKLIEKLQEKM